MSINDQMSREEALEHADDQRTSPAHIETLGDVISRRVGRRDILKGALGVSAIAATTSAIALTSKQAAAGGHAAASFSFDEIQAGVDETHHVANGYDADVLVRWGDPIHEDAPEFDPYNQSAAAQLQQFGYNNDFVGTTALPYGTDGNNRALLCVNHEYTNEEVMFPGLGRQDRADFVGMTKELVDVEMAAHGGSVLEIVKENGKWSVVKGSEYNRRISALQTEMEISGPAAGHDRMRTSYDQTGTKVIGTINNCAGGITPWGTFLMAEENFNGYFWNKDAVEGHVEEANYKRMGLPGQWYAWGKFHNRFDIAKEPNEGNRFGWIVEVDPYDPTSTPIKRTALGRFKHEGAATIINSDGRLVVYSGDDQRFDYTYKYVSNGTVNLEDRTANSSLLDNGVLSVARFNDDGTVSWLPLVHGNGPLTAENGFNSQADVLINTRLAADALGATAMDRPEDVEANPTNGKVYIMLTNNSRRDVGQENIANPRANNLFGHIIEMIAPQGDHSAETFAWDFLVKCGDPAVAEVGAMWNPATTENGWFAAPDNCAVDHDGRLWITTDQGSGWSRTGKADGVYAMETEGELRGTSKLFFRVPLGAEMCGPWFTPDNATLLVAVQHPATDGVKAYPGFERDSTFEDPATRWPDFQDGIPPRPSVVTITKQGGGKIA